MQAIKEAASAVHLEKTYFEFWWRYRRHFEPKTEWNDRQRAFFIHIPKTAGTSLYRSLQMQSLPYTHVPARMLKEFYPVQMAQYFSFAVVRNPYDRMVSLYRYVTGGSDWGEQRAWADRVIGARSFTEFVTDLAQNRGFRRKVFSENFFFPQSYFVSDFDGSLIVPNIYRFEDLPDAYPDLARRFGADPELSAQRVSGARQPYQEHYTDETRDIVARLYAEDIARFGYAFD